MSVIGLLLKILSWRRGAAEAVVDGDSEPFVRDGRDCDGRTSGCFGLMQPVEQGGGGFNEVAGAAEAAVACYVAEADQPFAIALVDCIEAPRLPRSIMTGERARRPRRLRTGCGNPNPTNS